MQQNSRAKQPLVLIVEDNVDLAEMYMAALDGQHFAVSIAHNARGGWEAATQLNPSLVLLDINLGDGSGLDLLDKLNAHLGSGRPKVVMFTNLDDPVSRARAAVAGADGYLLKAQIRLRSLADEISALIGSGPDRLTGGAMAGRIW